MKTPEDQIETETGEITQLLKDWRASSPGADDNLLSAVYSELHYLASRYLKRERQRPQHGTHGPDPRGLSAVS